MQNLTGLLARFTDAELPLRPLMYAAGAAVTAAGVYYYIRKKKCDDEEKERRAEQEDTPLSQALPAGSSGVIGGLTVPRTDSSSVPAENLEVSLTEAEDKCKLATESCTQLEKEKSILIAELNTLRVSNKETKRALDEMSKKYCDIIMEYEQVMEAHTIMKIECHQMRQCVKKWCEIIEDLRTAQMEAELKCRQVMMTNADLEKENFKLSVDSEVLQDCLHELEEKHKMLQDEYDEFTRDFALHWKNHSDLYFKHKQTTEMFIHSEMLLRNYETSLAASEERSDRLTIEMSKIMTMVSDLQLAIKRLEGVRCWPHARQDETTSKEEQRSDSQCSENDEENEGKVHFSSPLIRYSSGGKPYTLFMLDNRKDQTVLETC